MSDPDDEPPDDQLSQWLRAVARWMRECPLIQLDSVIAATAAERAEDIDQAVAAAEALEHAAQVPLVLASACTVHSEPHLSGYRLVLGFETLEQVQAAHAYIVSLRLAASEIGNQQDNSRQDHHHHAYRDF